MEIGGGSISSWERNQASPYVAPVERVRPMKELSEQTSEDLAVWGQQTSWGAAFGFVYGWTFMGAYMVLAAAGFAVFGGWLAEVEVDDRFSE